MLVAATVFAVAAPSEAQDRFAPLRTFLDTSLKDGSVAGGAILVIEKGKTVFETGFGYADVESKRPFEPDTRLTIASISKPVLGTAAFRLMDAGKLNGTDPVSKYIPEFRQAKLATGKPVNRSPTVIELFSHTSGIRRSNATGGRPWLAKWTRGQRLRDVVAEYAREFPFEAEPGTRFAYSGIGTDLAAAVLETTAERTRNQILLDELCGPLGMNDTFYRDFDPRRDWSLLATSYRRGHDGKLFASVRSWDPGTPPDSYTSSGGSIVSTARDMAVWLSMIRKQGMHNGKRYLSERMFAAMLSPAGVGNRAQGGLHIREKDADGKPIVLGHGGSTGTDCWIDLKQDAISIVFTQTAAKHNRKFTARASRCIKECLTGKTGN